MRFRHTVHHTNIFVFLGINFEFLVVARKIMSHIWSVDLVIGLLIWLKSIFKKTIVNSQRGKSLYIRIGVVIEIFTDPTPILINLIFCKNANIKAIVVN